MTPKTDPSYSFASGIFSRERAYHLGDDALRWEDASGHGGRLAYADVETVHIFDLYQPYGLGTQVCVIRAQSRVKYILKSKNFRPWGRSDDRSGAFVPFVRDLVGRIAAAAPQAHFFDGLPPGRYFSHLFALAACVLIIAAALAPMIPVWWSGSFSGSGDEGTTLLIALVVFIPLAIGASRTLLRGRARRFDPRRLPDKFAAPRLAPQL